MRRAPVGSGSDHRAENRTIKCPESLCRRSALPPSKLCGPDSGRHGPSIRWEHTILFKKTLHDSSMAIRRVQ